MEGEERPREGKGREGGRKEGWSRDREPEGVLD
jgi:hypothetical protein